MRKTAAFLLALTTAGALLTACGKDKDSSGSNTLKPASFDTTEDTTGQPDPLEENMTETETEAVASETAAAPTEAPAAPTESSPTAAEGPGEIDPLGGGAFAYDSNGAVEFEGDYSVQDDRVLISAAQALFQSACSTEWNFRFDCPYTLDTDNIITNQFGWSYKLVTDPGITTIDDVKSDYFKVFSDRYPVSFEDEFIEQDGKVYALAPKRGGDIFYSASKITAVQSRTEDEIFFTVENYYDGTDLDGTAPYTKTETFSAVIGSDGVWRAGKFRLPY